MNSATIAFRQTSENDALNKGFVARYDDNGSPVFVGLVYNFNCKPASGMVVGDLDMQNQCIVSSCDNSATYGCVPGTVYVLGYN